VTAALMLAAGFGLGAKSLGLLFLAGAVYYPIPTAVLVGLLIWRGKSKPSARSALFCDAVAGELRSGDSLRNSLQTAARSVDAPRVETLCRSGASLNDIATAVRQEFGDIGEEMEALLGRAPSLGVPPAALFDEVANVALAQVTVNQEVAAATAPARATALVLFGALVWGVTWAVGGGGFAAYLETSAQRTSALIGMSLVVLGFATAVWMLLRDR
jgi:hypothetical protein